jgi:hypothetical protein
MLNTSQIKEYMEVKGSDGKHVGTVLCVELVVWTITLTLRWSTRSKMTQSL